MVAPEESVLVVSVTLDPSLFVVVVELEELPSELVVVISVTLDPDASV